MARRPPQRAARAPAGPSSPLPDRFGPQLATPAVEAPAGDDWLHEIKLDGYRIGCRIDHGAVDLLSRQNQNWTAQFPEIRSGAAALPVETAFLDGEVAVMRPDGRTSFDGLQKALAGGTRAGLTYFVFDLLHIDGRDLTSQPIEERKRRLASLLASAPVASPLRFADHVEGNGPRVFAEACRMGLEGIVSKRARSPYRPGRSGGWLKVKSSLRQEFVIGGFTPPEGEARQGIGALLCGYHDKNGRLRFAGKVGTGFSLHDARALRERLEAQTQGECPFTPVPDALARRRARWVRPTLVAEVAFRAWTDDDKIRHSSFVGLRADKPARAVTREQSRRNQIPK